MTARGRRPVNACDQLAAPPMLGSVNENVMPPKLGMVNVVTPVDPPAVVEGRVRVEVAPPAPVVPPVPVLTAVHCHWEESVLQVHVRGFMPPRREQVVSESGLHSLPVFVPWTHSVAAVEVPADDEPPAPVEDEPPAPVDVGVHDHSSLVQVQVTAVPPLFPKVAEQAVAVAESHSCPVRTPVSHAGAVEVVPHCRPPVP
jgi:hypothetical protein